MPPVFTKLLAERLATRSLMPVREANGGEPLTPGNVWLAPGGHHLKISKVGEKIHLCTDDSPPRNYCSPSVDVLFESAVGIYGAATLAVILTGMGNDGLRSCEGVRKQGGQVLVQDEATSVVWGMPGAVARAGLADCIKPVDQIAEEIVRRVMNSRLPRPVLSSAPLARSIYINKN